MYSLFVILAYFCAGALAYLPLIPLLGVVVFGGKWLLSSNSGSKDNSGNVNGFMGYPLYTVVCIALTVGIYLAIKSSYSNVTC